MTDPDELHPLAVHDLEGLHDLLRACLEHDGGLPTALEPDFVRRSFLSGPGVGARDVDGRLVAATALGSPSQGVVPISGAVHPTHRGRGFGTSLLRWSIRAASGERVQLRSEAVTVELEQLAREFGFSKTFGELVMCRSSQLPLVPLPAIPHATEHWTADSAHAFYDAYVESFAERPGFPGWTEREWVDQMTSDDGFRPESSMVVYDPSHLPIGFVLVESNWIEQVGVAPAWRRTGLAKALVGHAIEQVAAGGADTVWLNVNEDNAPAISLYQELGFTRYGRRARYEQSIPG